MAPPSRGVESQAAGRDRRRHEEQQQRPHAVVAEALPHLGEEQGGEAARVTEERGVRRGRVGHKLAVSYPSIRGHPPAMPLDEYRKKRDFKKTPEPSGDEPATQERRHPLLLRPEAPGQSPALRPAARAQRRAAVVGRAQGAVDQFERPAAGDADRGPPLRLRLVRGRDSRGLRRRRGDAVGSRDLDAASRPTSTPR